MWPVAIEPMNPTACVPGSAASSSPTTGPGPVTTFTTPAGRSASSRHPANRAAQTLVVGAGAQTTAFPYAIAGARISPGIVYGQFQGLMIETMPRGTRSSRTRLFASTEGGSSPSARVASAAAISKYAISSSTSSNASARLGFP